MITEEMIKWAIDENLLYEDEIKEIDNLPHHIKCFISLAYNNTHFFKNCKIKLNKDHKNIKKY